MRKQPDPKGRGRGSHRPCLSPCRRTWTQGCAGRCCGWSPSRWATFAQPLRLTNAAAPEVSRAYVLCTAGKEDEELPGYVQRARSDPGWRFVELAAGHRAHVTAPRVLVDVLAQLTQPG
jgi:hypothetical protein